MIDLRSDTVTRPGKEMLEVMQNAAVGDDVFAEDPTVNALQKKAAGMFGMEAALFCPSGTMTNQIAIKLHTQAGDEVICHRHSHIYNFEGGGMAFNSACQAKLLDGDGGLINAGDVAANINNPHDMHAARTSLVSVENTSNKGGGRCYELSTLEEIGGIAKKHKLKYHLDGARLFNALIAKKQQAMDYGKIFDTISICLSKGLGCPVGSLLLGREEAIYESRRIRKKLGGGMRQAGYIAAAGIYALDNNIERLGEDHEKALMLTDALKECGPVERTEQVETNIVIFYLKPGEDQTEFLELLKTNGILAIGMGQGKLRFVTHLDNSFGDIEKACKVIRGIGGEVD